MRWLETQCSIFSTEYCSVRITKYHDENYYYDDDYDDDYYDDYDYCCACYYYRNSQERFSFCFRLRHVTNM